MFKDFKLYIAKRFIEWYDKYRAKHLRLLQDAAWEEMLEAALESLTDYQKLMYSTLLENQITFIRSNHSPRSYTSNRPEPIVDSADAAVFKMVVKMIPQLDGLRQIVGIQPMSGPVGLVYSMVYKDKERPDGSKGLGLEIIKQAVEAGSRKLRARFAYEDVQDLQAIHGLNIENELSSIIAQEVVIEIYQEIYADLLALANKSTDEPEYDLLGVNAFQMLPIRINQLCNSIAAGTRRGAGNFIVVSPIVLTALTLTPYSNFKPSEESDPAYQIAHGPFEYAGTMHGCIKVFVNPYAEDDNVLVGYKGGNGETDAGYFYCPYVLLFSQGIIVDPQTFQPTMAFMTRYGKSILEPAKGGFTSSPEEYYRVLKLTNLDPEDIYKRSVEVQTDLFESVPVTSENVQS